MLKKTFKFVGIFFVLFALIIGLSFINHRIQLTNEDKLFVPFGQMIQLDCSHYVHDIDYNRISKESELFIDSIKMAK